MSDAKKSMMREKGLREIDLQMERLRRSIGSVASFLGRQLIDASRQKAIRQLDIVLECAVQCDCRPLNEIVDEYLPAFKKNDVYAVYYNHNHHCYGALQDIMKEWFSFRIAAKGELCRGEDITYSGLVRERFATSEEARCVLGKELEAGAKAVRLVEGNHGLLKLPFGLAAHKVIDYMREELDVSLRRLSEEIDRIYSS